MNVQLRRRQGFTMIELLVVISIIAVLSAIGVASFSGSQKRARDARRQADLEAVRSALELYRADNPVTGYPAGSGTNGTNARYTSLCCGGGTALLNYMNTLPQDPKGGANVYTYQYNSATSYSLCATQEVLLPAAYCVTPP